MKKFTLAAGLLALSMLPFTASAQVIELPALPDVAEYTSPATGDKMLVCTGGTGGGYFREGAEMSGFVEAYSQQLEDFPIRLSDVSPMPGGGTYGCLAELAAGTVDAAVIQSEARALPGIRKLSRALDSAGALVTEYGLTICSRENKTEDFGDIGEQTGALIILAGGETSGHNVMLNLLASKDKGFNRPEYDTEKNFFEAASEVADGEADCAFGVMALDSPVLKQVNDKLGDKVRLVGTWDGEFRDIDVRGKQVLGWTNIPEDTPHLAKLLSWRGDGKGMWSPEVVTTEGLVVYREGLADPLVDLLKAAVLENQNLDKTVRN